MVNQTHGAYKVMRLAKEGELPDGRTHLGKALTDIKHGYIDYYGPLSYPQELTLFRLITLYAFWLQHPGQTDKGELAQDWKFILDRIERHERQLAEQEKDKRVRRPKDGLAEHIKLKAIESKESHD